MSIDANDDIMTGLAAPFPFFGGKRTVAPVVWDRFGAVDHYIEPFAGSLAVLLGRPSHCFPAGGYAETVNDVDALLANFWRALAADPDTVAEYADQPVNEADLTARHIWLVNTKADLYARVCGDADYYCAKTAGWWVWGISAWIGSGWCSGDGPWNVVDGKLAKIERTAPGLPAQRQDLGFPARGVLREPGVRAKMPHLGDAGHGVHRQTPRLDSRGQGVNRQLPNVGGEGRGVLRPSNGALYDYMAALASRLRKVRVCCGDWSRICTDGAMDYGNRVGVFLDPPYASTDRENVYNHDTTGLAAEVQAFCLRYGDNPRYRIALCGYAGEYDLPGWAVHLWTANRAYGNSAGASRNSVNRGREAIWFSPACNRQRSLFEEGV